MDKSAHDVYLFDRPERIVVRGPFRVWPNPPWFVTSKNADEIFPRLVELESRPGVLRALRVALAALS
jgi:hypothetical protein